MPCALDVKVVGLVTRKDLARYHMGKDGLEELQLAQTWLVIMFTLDPAFRAPALDLKNSRADQSLSRVKDAKHKPATCTICLKFSILRAWYLKNTLLLLYHTVSYAFIFACRNTADEHVMLVLHYVTVYLLQL